MSRVNSSRRRLGFAGQPVLVGGFHALGHGSDTHAVGQRHRRGHDRGVRGVSTQPSDERLVDLARRATRLPECRS